jgi:L-lysine 6-transaminase
MSVIERLKQHILVDGFHVVVDLDKSEGSWIVDAETGQRYLDCYSQFASQTFGWNYLPFLRKDTERLKQIALYKLANSDMYSTSTRTSSRRSPASPLTSSTTSSSRAAPAASRTPSRRRSTGSARWTRLPGQRRQLLDVIHLKQAFHGRSGYTLSLTNSGRSRPSGSRSSTGHAGATPNQQRSRQ